MPEKSIEDPVYPSRKALALDAIGCMDCGALGGYMVHDDVWLKALPNYHELKRIRKLEGKRVYLCIVHLQHRLGRPLTIRDFKLVPINDQIRFAFHMGQLDASKR